MKKNYMLILAFIMVILMTACSQNIKQDDTKKNEDETKTETEISKHKEVTIKTSPDKYTWYVKDYVGKNLASFGYTSLGGDRMDHYGEGYIELALINQSGKYIDIENEDELKKYYVAAQNLEPNTEIKYTFQKDAEGNDENGLISSQTVEEILLYVKEVGNTDDTEISLTPIQTAPDAYTYYIRDYVGRNLEECGYLSLAGDFRDAYGAATVKFVLIPDDGSYIDPTDEEQLKNYKVTEQNIAPNTEINFTLQKDSNGEEYDNLTENQNIEEVELHLSLVEE